MSENDNECNYLDAMVGLHLGDCFEIIPQIYWREMRDIRMRLERALK